MGNDFSSYDENEEVGCSLGYAKNNSIKVSFDMSALEEGRLPGISLPESNEVYQKQSYELVDISTAVIQNSFVAYSKKDAESLVLKNETLDYVGGFPYLCDKSEVESFYKLFNFVAENNFQLVTVDKHEIATLDIFVIRPATESKV